VKPHLIIIPAYNEERHIKNVLECINRQSELICDVLVIDDGSIDTTADLAEKFGAAVLSLGTNVGYGRALQAGYRYAAEKDYEYIAQMDGDGQHDAACVKKLFGILEADWGDVVIGSRFLDSTLGGTYRAGPLRRSGMIFFSALVTLATGRMITDPTSGFRSFHRRVLPLLLHTRFPRDFPDADAIIFLTKCGARVVETAVPMYTKDERKSIHSGWNPFFYAFKMTFSVMQIALREAPLHIRC
jgi:glycosyltransferase involved in cell wall biosynthesis